MQNPFYFNTDKFNFWPVYEAIQKYYPLGVPHKEEEDDDFYREYPGYKALESLIFDNVHNAKNYRQRWKSFEKEIKLALNKKVEGSTFGTSPSFSAAIVIEQWRKKEVSYFKELNFVVSLLGPLFTIYGLDSTNVKLKMDHFNEGEPDFPVNFFSINALTISPTQEYKPAFLKLEEMIRQRFSGYKFVPYEIYSSTLDNLHLPYFDKANPTIFNAIFNTHHEFPNTMVRGNAMYGSNEWLIKS